MDIQTDVKNLHPLEVRIIRHYKSGDELTIEKVEADLGFKGGNGNQALSWLAGKEIVKELRRTAGLFYELTELGRDWIENGIPEERMLNAVCGGKNLTMPEMAKELGLENKDVGSAFGFFSKAGVLAMDEAKRIILSASFTENGNKLPDDVAEHFAILKDLLCAAYVDKDNTSNILANEKMTPSQREIMGGIAKKRGASGAAFRIIEKETVVFGFTEKHEAYAKSLAEAGISGDEIGILTPEMLTSGSWKNKSFRSYNVNVPPVRLIPGRSNPYCQFLENVKDKLSSLGFEEFDGPLVETEFWNSDALFMPQFHSARDIHDVYHISEPAHAKKIDEPWLTNIANAHRDGGQTGSRGWNYQFDEEFTRRLILRSQGTVLSAKQLPNAKIPGKYFGMARCFRYDKVDATHLSDFYQTEGIVLGEDVNLRTLLGLLEMFAVEVAGAKEVKYVPGYFPFTEPSIEVHIKHPVLGWFELGGSGIFRPEVTASLGVDVPVAAWGIGIDRMALMALGINDIRDLFSYDIENVRLRRAGA